MGLQPKEEQLKEIFQRVKSLGDKGKTVMDADVLAIAENVMDLGKTNRLSLRK